MNERAIELLKHPLTGLALGVSFLGQFGFGWFDFIWGFLSTTSGLWFPIVATISSTILPEIGLDGLGTNLLIAGALLFIGVQLDKLWDRTKTYLDNR